MTDLDDILSSGKGKLSEEKLLAYLEGRLSATEAREVEKLLADEGMEADALEGLQHLPAGKVKATVKSLNHKLRTSVARSKRKPLRSVNNNYWSLIAVIIILLICLAGYLLLVLAK